MIRCELFDTCAFLNNQAKKYPATISYLMRAYCKVNHKACARFMVFMAHGREMYPQTFFPVNTLEVSY